MTECNRPINLIEQNIKLKLQIKANYELAKESILTFGKMIPGTGNRYKISNCGVIYDIFFDKFITLTNLNGYKIARIHRNGRLRTQRVHRLILEAFVGKSDLYVNHKNGIRSDNRIENLEYCTPQQNILHAQNTLGVGANPYGKSKQRRLDDIQVLTILTMTNMTKTELAKHYKLSAGKINDIVKGYIYKEFLQIPRLYNYKEGRGNYLKINIRNITNIK